MSIASQQLPFFVYGTLMPGQPNSYLWGDTIVGMIPAVYDGGNLYDLGYFPMMVEEPGGTVRGVVVEIGETVYQKILTTIDHLEGFVPDHADSSTYRRLERLVTLSNGSSRKVWLYAGQKKLVHGLPQIPDGDWMKYSRGMANEMSSWWSSISTVYGYGNNIEK